MTTQELEMLVEYGEDSRIDRKRSLRLDTDWHRMEFVKDVMAFANGHELHPAYILIGVDDEGTLHGAGSLPDEATLQQIVNNHVDPPVSFSLSLHTLRGVRLGVVRIEPSAVRFHMSLRDVSDARGKSLLRQGETLIRRGTSKMPLRPLDMQRLKEEYARQQTPQPELSLKFAKDAEDLAPKPAVLSAEQLMVRTLGHFMVPSRLGFSYHLLELRFYMHNIGQAQAEAFCMEANFPPECQVVAAYNDEQRRPQWSLKLQRSHNSLRIHGGVLVHNDWHSPGKIFVRCPRQDRVHAIRWMATAGNSPSHTAGVLRLRTTS